MRSRKSIEDFGISTKKVYIPSNCVFALTLDSLSSPTQHGRISRYPAYGSLQEFCIAGLSNLLNPKGSRSVRSVPPPRPPLPDPVPGSVMSDHAVQKVIDSNRPEAEIYSWSLYPRGFGLPIWSPTPVKIGSFGYFLDGQFRSLDVNILEDGDDQLFPHAKTRATIGRSRITSGLYVHKGGVVCPSLSRPTPLSPRQDK